MEKEDVLVLSRLLVPLVLLASLQGAKKLFTLMSSNTGAGVSGSVAIGVTLAVTASVMNALGLNLQRLGQKSSTKDNSKLNAIGIALATSSGIVDLISFGFAPQSLLAPLSSVTLIANLVMAPLIHQESLEGVDLLSTVIVCVGIAVCLRFGSDVSPTYSLMDIRHLACRPVFLLFILAYFGLLIGLAAHVLIEESRGRENARFVALGYPVVSGMLGGMTVLHAKVLTEILKVVSIRTHFALVLALALALLFFAVSQVTVLNRGIGKHSSLFVVPLFSASILLANLSAGMVFFDEIKYFRAVQLVGFLSGVALVVGGVSLLATKDVSEKSKRKST